MAVLAVLDMSLALNSQQFGTADTSAVRRGVIAQREVKLADSTLTRATAHQQVEIAAGETLAISMGSMGAPRLLYIETDRTVSVRTSAIDGEVTTVAPLATGAPGILLKTGAFAGVWITNPGTNAAIVAVLVAGLESA